MDKKRMTVREKLELMKEIDRRNEQRRKEFAEQTERKNKLIDMYLNGLITKDMLEKETK